MSRAQDFDDLFPAPAKKSPGVDRLEAQKRRVIAETNFWIRLRDKARAEAIAAGAKPEAETQEGQGEG